MTKDEAVALSDKTDWSRAAQLIELLTTRILAAATVGDRSARVDLESWWLEERIFGIKLFTPAKQAFDWAEQRGFHVWVHPTRRVLVVEW